VRVPSFQPTADENRVPRNNPSHESRSTLTPPSDVSTVTRRALTAWLSDHGFAELGGRATSHRRFRHESGVVITVPGHGKQNLSQKHVGMIVRQLEAAGFDRDTVRRELNAR
jgi:predicted RNA binding protein YcfA (HicA-like mRNA interferase family)